MKKHLSASLKTRKPVAIFDIDLSSLGKLRQGATLTNFMFDIYEAR